MSQVQDIDPWLGVIRQFPQVLHARASLVYDVTNETMQKALVNCLIQLQKSTRGIELSVSNQDGYQGGTMSFRVGVGNDDGFDILNGKEEDRVLRKLLRQGAYPVLDFMLNIHYKVETEGRHRVAVDRYLTRMTFQVGRAEVLVHHLRGLRRIDPGELIQLLLSIINADLTRKGYGRVDLEESKTV